MRNKIISTLTFLAIFLTMGSSHLMAGQSKEEKAARKEAKKECYEAGRTGKDLKPCIEEKLQGEKAIEDQSRLPLSISNEDETEVPPEEIIENPLS